MALKVDILKSTWAQLEPHAAEFGKLFYQTMFTDYPAVKTFFQFTNVEKQSQMLLKSLAFVINHLDNMEALVQALKEMGKRHLYYKTEPEHYKVVGANLIKTMGLYFGILHFTPEIKQAWVEAYDVIVSVMLSDLKGWDDPAPMMQFYPLSYKVVDIIQVSHDTKILKFEMPHAKNGILPLPVGRHIQIVIPREGKPHLFRDYTPIRYDEPGHFELLIKKYPEGSMSTYVHDLKVGSMVQMRGMSGAYEFHAEKVKKYAMIAAGTGICPIWQVIKAALKQSSAEVKLLFANKKKEDLLLQKEIEELKASSEGRFSCTYIFSREEVEGSLHGHISAESISQALYSQREDGLQVLICGPDAFSQSAVAAVTTLGFTSDDVFVF